MEKIDIKIEIGEVPEGWEVKKLGDICENFDNKRIPLKAIERLKIKGEYPYCGANGIIDYISKYIFDGNYILLVEDGGEYERFKTKAYEMNCKFWANNHVHILKAKEGYDQKYILYYLNFSNLNFYIVGTTRKKLNQEDMNKILVALPKNYAEQQKIAEILATVDEGIEVCGKRIEKLERYKKGMMQKLLTRGIGHKKFKKTEIGEVPEGWEVVELKDIGKVITGGTPSTKNKEFWGSNIMFVTPTDFKQQKYIDKTERYLSYNGINEIRKIPKYSVMVTCIASIGEIAINKKECATNQQINSIICNSKYFYEFIYYLLKYKKNYIKQHAGKTTNAIIKKSKFEILKFAIPKNYAEQQKIAEILSTIDEQIELERQRKEKFERYKKGLMNELLTGRKRVKIN